MQKATREWVRKAEKDYRLAEDLDDLLGLLRALHPVLTALRRGLLFLTGFAVDTRYPGEWATKRQATAALRWAGRIRQACRTLLGIRSR